MNSSDRSNSSATEKTINPKNNTMKKILLIAVLIGAMLSVTAYIACVAMPMLGKTIKGSGNIVTKTIPAPDFNSIEASHAVKVIVTDKVSDIRIDADDNLMDLVEVKSAGNTLVVRLSDEARSTSNIHVTVTVPYNEKLGSIHASGATQVTVEPTLTAPKVEIEASGASKVNANARTTECKVDCSGASKISMGVQADICKMECSGASKLEVTGTAGDCKVDVSGASSCNASELVSETCNAKASGASKAQVNCTRKLNAQASGASKIAYTGGSTDNTISKSGASSVSRQ